MALVHLRQRNLPEDRASLYRECVEILLARWELRGKEETEYQTWGLRNIGTENAITVAVYKTPTVLAREPETGATLLAEGLLEG